MNRPYSEIRASTSTFEQREHSTHQRDDTEKQSILKNHGCIRLYSNDGERSTIATITLETTAREISDNYKVEGLYFQTGNLHIRPLSGSSKPLVIFSDFISSLGFDKFDLKNSGADTKLRSIIAFFLGRPNLQSNSSIRSEILMADCQVRRGRLVHRWNSHKCMLYNGTIRIQKDTGEDDVIYLARLRVDLHESRRGRCLRVSDPNFTILFLFEEQETLLLWLTRCQQNVQSSSCDLSDQRLTLLPESIFATGSETIRHLNLRRNSLTTRDYDKMNTPLLGWLDDLTRLHALTSLDLSFNQLSSFPLPVTELYQLQKLNLSSNKITAIPADVKLMANLTTLDLSNNRLSSLPNQLVECSSLSHINLGFNLFPKVPLVLRRLDLISEWLLAGNFIEEIEDSTEIVDNLQKLDLRRNCLSSEFRLPTSFTSLSHLDIRDNNQVATVHITNIPSLKVFHCSRLQLTSLYLNGQSLTHLHADHNLLESLVVMPTPTNLVFLDVCHNHFEVLPEWVADLPNLTAVRANHNRLTVLPPRIFCMPSLRLLSVHNNLLSRLPEFYGECALETLLIQTNHLDHLPNDIFKMSRRLLHLNASFNKLRSLPSAHSKIDWNRIQILRLSSNFLDETTVPVLIAMKRLRTLDLSHNRLKYFDDSALYSLTLLEELNVSSNQLRAVSPSIPLLPALTTLRMHSNHITFMPDLSQSLTIQLADLSNNDLHQFDPLLSTAPSLRCLDLTCNPGVNVNAGTLRRQRKPVSLVDIGREEESIQIGFSDTTGSKSRSCVRRIRHSSVFGLVDGGSNYELPKYMKHTIEQALNRPNCDLRDVLLSTHISLEEEGERLGASVTLIRIGATVEVAASGSVGVGVISGCVTTRLELAGELDESDYSTIREAGHWVDEHNMINGVTTLPRQLGMYFLHPAVAPRPVAASLSSANVDYVILASHSLWDHLPTSIIADIVSQSLNPQVAAKRLQDALQGCDYAGNSSITVIRLKKPEQMFDSDRSTMPRPYTNQLATSSRSDADLVPPLRFTPEKDGYVMRESNASVEHIADVARPLGETSRADELDEGFVSGRRLYERILADELSSSSLSTPPPDPKSSNSLGTRPTAVSRNQPQKRAEEQYSLISPRSQQLERAVSPQEGRYIVSNQTVQHVVHSNQVSDNEPPTEMGHGTFVQPRALSIIREMSDEYSTELELDEPHSFSHHSRESLEVPTMSPPPPPPLSPSPPLKNSLTATEKLLSNRYRFEYAGSDSTRTTTTFDA